METVKLGLLIKKTKVARCGKHSYPVLSITKQNGIIMQSEKFKKRIASADTSDYKIIPRGKLVQGIHIDEGNFGIQDIVDNGIVSPAYGVWDVNDGLVIPKYLEMVLRSPKSIEFYRSKLTGTVNRRGHMSDTDFLSMDIPLPDRDTQSEILKTMKQTTSILCFRQQQLAKLDELIKARFAELFGSIYNNIFGFDVMTLQDVCEQIKDGTHQTPMYTDDTINGYKFLSSKDVTTGKIDWNHLKYIPGELHTELYKKISPKKGDILLAKNGTTGIAAIVDRDEVFDIYVSLALLRPLQLVTSEYLCAAVNSAETKQQFDSSLKGIGVPNLHLGEIKKTKIIVPPIELQNQFTHFTNCVNKSKAVVQKSLDETQVLFDSLMQKYFG